MWPKENFPAECTHFLVCTPLARGGKSLCRGGFLGGDGRPGHRWGRRLEGFDTLCKGGALGRTLERWNPYDSAIGRLPVLGSLLGREPVLGRLPVLGSLLGREPVSGRLPVLGLLPVLGRLPVLERPPVLERLPDGFFHG